jgi:cell division transport system ATP-binding protein
MIELHQVSKYYTSTIPALFDVSLKINKGDFVFLTGPSGAGKTTLLKLLFLSERPNSGKIIVNGTDISHLKPSAIPHFRRSIGVVYQDFKLITTKTIFENVAFPLYMQGLRSEMVKRRAWQVLKWVGLLQKNEAYPQSLSGGEQQRVAIARAIINSPLLLLADEPTGNLDNELAFEIMKLFKAINVRGTTVVIATHNNAMARQFSDHIIHLGHEHSEERPHA